MKELTPIAEWCKSMGIGITKTYELLKAGELRAVKIGNRTLITKEETQRFISSLPVAEFRK